MSPGLAVPVECPHCRKTFTTVPPIGPAPEIATMPSRVLPVAPPAIDWVGFDPFSPPSAAPIVAAPVVAAIPKLLNAPEGDHPAKQFQTVPATTADDPFDHPYVGGRFTICVLMYGNYHDMHKRCLNSILSTVAPHRRQIRIACNEVCAETLDYLSRLQETGQISRLIVSQTNRKKYPMLRELFYDQTLPITDKWIVWFDDDSIADRDARWATKLAQTIISCYDQGYRMLGELWSWKLSPDQIKWVKSRPWYRGRPFQTKNGTFAPNGDTVKFATGGFWALETSVMRQVGIPDEQIGHNGGDYICSLQVLQAGYSIRDWNRGKKLLNTSSVKRRGLNEAHTGTKNWKPGGK